MCICRLHTFRLCPATKLNFVDEDKLEIDDGFQERVTLACADRNIIAATYFKFLLENIGGSETLKDKIDFFNHKLRDEHPKGKYIYY